MPTPPTAVRFHGRGTRAWDTIGKEIMPMLYVRREFEDGRVTISEVKCINLLDDGRVFINLFIICGKGVTVTNAL